MSSDKDEQVSRLNQAIAALEAQRTVLGDAVVEDSIAALNRQLGDLESRQEIIEQKRKLVSLLYVDVVGSTEIAQDLEPEEVVEIMDAALKRLALCIESHGGEVLRFMGDGFKSAFGVTTAREDDPERAILAGLDILKSAEEIAGQLSQRWGIANFRVRVGINTGRVAIGGETEGRYTVMGSAVNLASRLEQAASPGKILISHDTYRHVRGIFKVTPLKPVRVKGFAEPVQVYQVENLKERTFYMPTRGVEGVETRMIGRASELKRLQDSLYTAMEEGEGHVITIAGEAGAGKSRLLYEFDNWIELLVPAILFFKGRGRQETQKVPHALLKDVFAFRFQIQESDSTEVVGQKLEQGFGEVFGNDDSGRMKAHLIGQLLGFDLATSHPNLRNILEDPQKLHAQGVTSLVDFFQGLSQKAPVVVFLEDLHWADDRSLDVIDEMGKEVSSMPVLIVGIARTSLFERRPYWGEGQTYHTRIDLSPLSKRESRELVEEILKKMDQVPVALREMITSVAEGNPFYIEELIKMLIDAGVILKGVDHWTVAAERLLEVDVPPSLIEVLQARLDSLPDREREVIQQASVVGRLFWDQPVVFIQRLRDKGRSTGEVSKALENLRERELIYRRENTAFAGVQEYIFKHTILREVAYENLTKGTRQLYHGKVAEWLIEKSGERENEYAVLIADHLEEAGNEELAVDYLIRAGDRARAVYALTEAERSYRRAVDVLRKQGKDQILAKTLMKLGLVYTAAFEPEKARHAYDEAFAIREQPPIASSEHASNYVFRLALEEPNTLDPGMIHTDIATFMVSQLFEGLVRIGEDYNVLPAVAARWEVNQEGRRYRFHLRDDARWNDGNPVRAGDFEYAWKRNLSASADSPSANLLYAIKNARAVGQGAIQNLDEVGVRVIDDLTLEVTLESPTAYLPYILADSVAFPLPRWAIEEHGSAWMEPENLVTNGAYQLVEWERGERLILERNPYYQSHIPESIQRVEAYVFPEYQEALEAYAGGLVDAVSMFNADPYTIARAREAFGDELVSIPRPATLYLNFRCDKTPFEDVRVRKAFIHAIDRDKMSKTVFQEQRISATGGFVPPGMPGHSPDIGLKFEPDRAVQLLEEAGFPRGKGFPQVTWFHARGPGGEKLIEFLRSSWFDILNVDLSPEGFDWNTFQDRLTKDTPNLTVIGWGADFPDPDNMLRSTFHSKEGINRPQWHHLRFDNLIDEAGKVTDHKKRIKLYQEADRLLVTEQAVVMPLTYGQGRMLVKPWVKLPSTPSISMPLKSLSI